MSNTNSGGPAPDERSLDPENWNELRELGHQAIDDMIDYLRTVRDRPAWQPLPAETRALFDEGLPRDPSNVAAVYQQIQQHILPYPTNNIHPRFWSWVGGTGTGTQLIADLVMSAMNSAGLGFDEVASSYVELQLLDWLKELFDFPADASGLLVSGGSMANLVGLAVARTAIAPYDVREEGVDSANQPRLVCYASTETHSSVRKAVELLGLGSKSLRLIPVRDDFAIDVAELSRAIESDKADGMLPACIVGNVGTVNTGATDDVNALANIAEAENLWLHIDGAFGACTKLSAEYRHLAAGIERADSLAFDLHKWLYVQYDCGCILIRGDRPHKSTFSVLPAYLKNLERGLASGPFNFSEHGVQLSRSFKALRAWTAFKTEGTERYGEQISQNVRQAQYLSDLVDGSAKLERLAPTAMNIVNFRYAPPNLPPDVLDQLNEEILMLLQERGVAAPSSTRLNDCFSIRVAICNHRSQRSDFDALVAGAVAIGDELIERMGSRTARRNSQRSDHA